MNMAVFGDSFADYNNALAKDQPNESWVHTIQQQKKLDAWGRSGSSIWYSFELFKQHYSKYTQIVFCHSDMHRIHHLPRTFEGFSFVKPSKRNPHQNPAVNRLVDVYYKNFWNAQLDQYLAQSIFDSVNRICHENNIQLVNLLPFQSLDEMTLDLSTRKGMTIIGLAQLSQKERDVNSELQHSFGQGDNRWCHLTRENNQALAKLITTGFLAPVTLIDVNRVKSFVVSKENSNRYRIG